MQTNQGAIFESFDKSRRKYKKTIYHRPFKQSCNGGWSLRWLWQTRKTQVNASPPPIRGCYYTYSQIYPGKAEAIASPLYS